MVAEILAEWFGASNSLNVESEQTIDYVSRKFWVQN